ncbi:hypothetical protein BAUCODRAFT_183237 [Baudoinia panamericana UAMH 10762]|uniref:Uncharacterized protein n=1 Tax=Baudoinia panamericana (strain UAMH 10762) TaxID=717646 RepID=M2NMN6_BAUPA|nr:uncharacterized protein BAUCODRAFT_183237 [Baudoinia panamericana UAMH 10762]EMD00795.1 hypothetical protein BAUCODRAFT_183237 [Baudoinia panamericana UAMH 10762]
MDHPTSQFAGKHRRATLKERCNRSQRSHDSSPHIGDDWCMSNFSHLCPSRLRHGRPQPRPRHTQLQAMDYLRCLPHPVARRTAPHTHLNLRGPSPSDPGRFDEPCYVLGPCFWLSRTWYAVLVQPVSGHCWDSR